MSTRPMSEAPPCRHFLKHVQPGLSISAANFTTRHFIPEPINHRYDGTPKTEVDRPMEHRCQEGFNGSGLFQGITVVQQNAKVIFVAVVAFAVRAASQ